jgi:3-dehydroquinate synthase
MLKVTIHIPASPTVSPVLIESGLIRKAEQYLAPALKGRKGALITDARVWKLYRNHLRDSLNVPGSVIHPFPVPEGEKSKSLSQVQELAAGLAQKGFDRGDTVIALGGGLILDLAGFLASVYMRGISYTSIPTTLLAQADACIGGKVGVNYANGRNLLGSFHHPHMVLVDPEVLDTLEKRDIRSGLGEVVKTALIGDKRLFACFEEEPDIFSGSWKDFAEDIIMRALRVKQHIIEKDEKERGPRMALNLGHTVGHALETATDYKLLRHGESVVVGILVASVISKRRGLLSSESFKRIAHVITRIFPGKQWKNVANGTILKALKLDKKKRRGRVPFVLPKRIGETVILWDVDHREIRKALDEVRNYDPGNI